MTADTLGLVFLAMVAGGLIGWGIGTVVAKLWFD